MAGFTGLPACLSRHLAVQWGQRWRLLADDDSIDRKGSAGSPLSIPLPVLLLVLIIASIAPLAAAGVALNVWYERLARQTQEAGLLYTTRSISAAVDAEIDKSATLADALARSPTLANDDLAGFEAEARRLFDDPEDGWVILASIEGRELVNTSYRQGTSLSDRRPEAIAQQKRVAQTGRFVVSHVYRSGADDSWAVMIDVPVFGAAGQKYGVAVALPARNFLKFLDPPDRQSQWLAGVMDQHGRYVARVPGGEAVIGERASEGWRATARTEGVAYFRNRENERTINANANSRMTEWTIGVGALERQIDAAVAPISRWAIVAAVLAIVLSLAFAYAIYRFVLHSLLGLNRAVAAALNGQAPDFRSPIAEFETLWRGLREATATKYAAERELAASESRFRLAARAARFGVYELSPATGAANWSGDLAEMFGIAAPIENMQTIMERFHPDDRERALQRIRQARRTVGPFEFEFRIVRPDGAVRWMLDRGESVGPLDGAGRVTRMTGTFMDITERKLVEERNKMLLREVNHRSKNLLTVIAVIARRTQSGTAAEFVKGFNARIAGLAANQDLLVATEWRGAELEQLVVAHLEPFCEDLRTRVTITGPQLLLGPEAAQNIGMALHELATNAAKYGALSNNAGRIAVAWTVSDGTFRLEWIERDGPEVRSPDHKGFGSTVLTTLVSTALSGETALSYTPGGLVWTLTCPAAKLASVAEQ